MNATLTPPDGGSPPARELTSSEKKRLRDRKAQKVLRERRERQLKHLQQQINECHRLHDPGRVQQQLDLIRAVQEENRVLRHRQEQLRKLVASWVGTGGMHDADAAVSALAATGTGAVGNADQSCRPIHSDDVGGATHDSPGVPIDPALTAAGIARASNHTDPALTRLMEPTIVAAAAAAASHHHESLIPITQLLAQSPEGTTVLVSNPEEASILPVGSEDSIERPRRAMTSIDMLPSFVPAWMLVPLDEESQSPISLATSPWLAHPDLVSQCPDVPSALDLLHGTRRNWLAANLHQSLRQHHCRDPEVLAMGWLLYVYAKWRVSPTPESFARIPLTMRPVLGQLQKTHYSCLDQIIWPQLRLNIMQHCSDDKILSVMALLSCCLKVRWKWGEDILERDENDELQIRQRFMETFLSADGWGITSEFINTYPELVEGMDLSRILYSLA